MFFIRYVVLTKRRPTAVPVRRRPGTWFLAMFLAILAVCVALRLWQLDRTSLWTDEIFSRYYYDLLGPRFLFTEGLRVEPTFPLYYVILRGWMEFTGASEYALRSLSVLMSVAALPLVYLLARELGSRRQALVAAGLYAICPFAVYFAHEARVYAMTLAPSCLVLLGVAMFLRGVPARRWMAPYVAGAVICLYSHATLVLLVASCSAAVLLHRLAARRPGLIRDLMPWVGANIAVIVLAGPAIFAMAVSARAGGLDWIGPLAVRDVVYGISALLSGMVTPVPTPGLWLAAAFGLTLAASLWDRTPNPRVVAILVLIPGCFVVIAVLLSLSRPIFLPRILCWLVVPLCVLTGYQLAQASRFRRALAVATSLTFLVGLAWQIALPDSTKEPWREALPALRPGLQRADLLVLSPRFNPLILQYYAPGLGNVRIWQETLPQTVMTAVSAKLGIAPVSRAEIIQAIAAGQRVWVLSNTPDLPFLATLARRVRPPAGEKQWLCGKTACITAMEWAPDPVQGGVAG